MNTELLCVRTFAIVNVPWDYGHLREDGPGYISMMMDDGEALVPSVLFLFQLPFASRSTE